MKYDVLVVGGGVNGLTTAAYLARAGKKVLVAERRATLGGLCATEEFHPGFSREHLRGRCWLGAANRDDRARPCDARLRAGVRATVDDDPDRRRPADCHLDR